MRHRMTDTCSEANGRNSLRRRASKVVAQAELDLGREQAGYRMWRRAELALAIVSKGAMGTSLLALGVPWVRRRAPALVAGSVMATLGSSALVEPCRRQARLHRERSLSLNELRSDVLDFLEVDLGSPMGPRALEERWRKLADRYERTGAPPRPKRTEPDETAGCL
jgi:hypothetical protein